MITINSKSFTVTNAMKEAVETQFKFLEESEFRYLRLKLEQLNPHTIRIKVIYQKPKQSTQTVEILTKDFYKGLDEISKKFRLQCNRQEERRRYKHQKTALSQTFENELAYAPDRPQYIDEDEGDIGTELQVPIYTMNLEEAVEQLNCFKYNVLIYTDVNERSLCVLVRQPDGDIKRYIGVPA